ncbi:hypothetical protein PHYSODRAFT_485999 [Phytophthora sojae]|uniref:Uncharacterized protein n=1 Tax=Phytophthora sojae (strain P6497) TaxID=1094619 RepID=G4YUG6_PHYSP|nr:hypothetical protein PHYSODRAFT_485999 [Phytophthora sojae]EGZ24858.1 hypothetical protein PHYSODRAFT_485999 [Phytophthora sojae]|eukprot:XP_009520146.1 hypothetical protein PHYSODRAFT_485999 [Phytophthora sojae]
MFLYMYSGRTLCQIRRPTEARVEASAAAISELLKREGDNMTYGPASQRYWAISHARQPEGTPLEPPTSATFAQLQRIDALQSEMSTSAAMAEQHQNESHQRQFVRVGCRLNGGVIDLDLDVADLRRAVGLPSYDLFPAFRPDLEHTTPAVNASDVDHTEPIQQ